MDIIEIGTDNVVTMESQVINVLEVAAQGATGAQGIPGIPGLGAAKYTHNQVVASSTWIINHNLGYYPSITPLTIGLFQFSATIQHVSINQSIIYMTAPMLGVVQCN